MAHVPVHTATKVGTDHGRTTASPPELHADVSVKENCPNPLDIEINKSDKAKLESG